MVWYPSRYDSLILAEPTLGRYYPLDESGGSGTPAYDRKSGYWLAVAGSTPAQIARNQPPLVLADAGRPATHLTTAAYLSSVGGASGAATAGLATGAQTWGLEAWMGGTTDTSNFLILEAFGTASANAGAFIAKDFGGQACVTSWNGTTLDGATVADGKPHYVAGWYDGTDQWLVVDGVRYGPSAVTYAITALEFAIGAQDNNGSYADAYTGLISKVAYYTSFSAALAMRHYLAGIHSGVLELVTPRAQTWPILAVNSGGGGSIVSGSATLAANATIAESAQVVAPSGADPLAANAILAATPGANVLATAPLASNAALVVTGAIVASPSAPLPANAAIAASAQLVAHGDALAGNATLAASAQLVTNAAVAQANAALATPNGAIVVEPTAPLQANAVLAATGGEIGQNLLIANAALVVSGAQIVTPAAPLAAYSVLAAAAQIVVATFALQGNAILAATGTASPPSQPGVITLSDTRTATIAASDARTATITVSDAG